MWTGIWSLNQLAYKQLLLYNFSNLTILCCKCSCTKRTNIWRSQDELKSSRKHQLNAVCASQYSSKDITLSWCRVGERSASFSEIQLISRLQSVHFSLLWCYILHSILVKIFRKKWKCAIGKINRSLIADFVIGRFYWQVNSAKDYYLLFYVSA